MHPGGPAWTALASEEISEYRKARDPYTPIPLVRMLRWLRRVGSRFARYRIVRRRFVQYTIVRRRFVLCIPIRCGRVRGRACRPVTLSAIAELPDPETPEGECRAGEDDHRCPHVEAKPQDDVGVVIAQHLDEQAAGRVEHAVERKDLAPGKGEAAVDQHERQGHEQAPQRLVEKRRLEDPFECAGGPRAVDCCARALVPAVDLKPPRQVCPAAMQLVVEVVAPPADRLGKDDAGRGRVGVVQQTDSVTTTADPGAHYAQGHGSPDAETTLPDLERIQGVLARDEVELGVRDHVVEPAADDPERDGPHRDVQRLTGLSTPVVETSLGDPDRYDDAHENEHRVGTDGERPEEPDRLLGTRDGGGQLLAALISATRASGVDSLTSLPLSFTVGVWDIPALPEVSATSATYWLC